TIKLTVKDDDNGSGTSSTTVTVNNVAPTANPDGPDSLAPASTANPFTTLEKSTKVIDVRANDTDPAGAINSLRIPAAPDDPLVVTHINGTPITIGVPFTLPSGATITVNANGTQTYNPNGAFFLLAQGQIATDSFTYTIDDGDLGTATATVVMTIIGQNDIWVDKNNDGLFNPGLGDIDVTLLAEDGVFDARFADGYYSSPIPGAGLVVNAVLSLPVGMNFTADGIVRILHSNLTTTGSFTARSYKSDVIINDSMIMAAGAVTLDAAQGTLTSSGSIVTAGTTLTAIAKSNADITGEDWTAGTSIFISVPGTQAGTGLLQANNATLTAPVVQISTGVDIQADDIVIAAVTEVTVYAYDHDITMRGAQIDASMGTVYFYGNDIDFSPSAANGKAMINGFAGVTIFAHYGTLTAPLAVITALGPGADVAIFGHILNLPGATITANDSLMINTRYQVGLATTSTIDVSLATLTSNTNDVQIRAFGTITAATASIAAVKLVSLFSQYDQISAPGVIIIASEIGTGQIKIESGRKLTLTLAELTADNILASSSGADLDAMDALFSVIGGPSVLDLFALDDLTLSGSTRQHTTQYIRSVRGTVYY
ncbi:MAG: Ig-like domain-containing protein, partial [Planctomycetota bacterium]|nr:Ig-like domain-containing protein [Planctomycetota bacterium]